MKMGRAMVFYQSRQPLRMREVSKPEPAKGQLLIRVKSCGVCRTDLHVVDGELDHPKLPLIPGHQIVGVVEDTGKNVTGYSAGDRVGVPWLGGSCGSCDYCKSGRENLCDQAVYTGYQIDGGFAEFCVANADYCFHLPEGYSDFEVAPLLCGGLIGFRAYRMTGDAKSIGFYGFGASAHRMASINGTRNDTSPPRD